MKRWVRSQSESVWQDSLGGWSEGYSWDQDTIAYLLAGRRLCAPKPRSCVLGPFAADSRTIIEICGIPRIRESKWIVGCVPWQIPLRRGVGERSRRFGGAQPEGEPEETENKEEQCSSFHGRRRGWIETRVGCLQNGGARSLSRRSRLRNLVLLVFCVELDRWPHGEWGVVAVGHRRRQLRALRSRWNRNGSASAHSMVRFKVRTRKRTGLKGLR